MCFSPFCQKYNNWLTIIMHVHLLYPFTGNTGNNNNINLATNKLAQKRPADFLVIIFNTQFYSCFPVCKEMSTALKRSLKQHHVNSES